MPGMNRTNNTFSAMDARNVCTPYQAMATIPRTSAVNRAPQMPQEAADHGVGRARVVAHEAGHAAAAEDDQRAAEDAQRDLDRAQPEQEQPRGEGVVADVVRVVHPEAEQAVGLPAPFVRFGRAQVGVVEPAFGVLGRERGLVDDGMDGHCLLRLLVVDVRGSRSAGQGVSGQPVMRLGRGDA